MNGAYFQNPTFPSEKPSNTIMEDYNEQSYIENILRLNKGRNINAYVSFPDSTKWNNKVFTGTIEQAGKDHLIIKSQEENIWYLIRIIYLDYVEFTDTINYLGKYNNG